MLDIGWTELMVIGIVALIVIGPKDLPGMFQTLGNFTAKIKKMGRDFSRAMEDAAKEAGVDDLKKTASGFRKAANPASLGLDALKDTAKDISDGLDPDSLGPETRALSEKRADQAKKIKASAARKAQERLDAEAAQASVDAFEADDEPAVKQAAPDATAPDAAETPEEESK